MWQWQFETVHDRLFGIGEAGWSGLSLAPLVNWRPRNVSSSQSIVPASAGDD